MDNGMSYGTERAYEYALRGFYGHVAAYAAAAVILAFVDWLTPGGPWFYWPLLVWGVAVGFQGLSLFVTDRFFLRGSRSGRFAKRARRRR